MIASRVSPHRRRNSIIINGFAWLVLIALALPAIWIILTAFRSNAEINASPPVWIPREITFEAFGNMFGLNPNLQQRVAVEAYMFNSPVRLFQSPRGLSPGTHFHALNFAFIRRLFWF
jgi:ABC-type glycerol-3-phosphate transport system permease component